MCIRYSRYEVHTYTHRCICTCCYWLSQLVFICVSLLKFSLPQKEHTPDLQPPRVHLVGSLNPSLRKTSTEAALRSRGRYDCHHKFRTVKCLCRVSRLGDCDLPLPEAVVFVCVHVIMFQYVLSYVYMPFKMPCYTSACACCNQ